MVRRLPLARVAARSVLAGVLAAVAAAAVALPAPPGVRAACGDPLPALGAIARTAPVVVLADVLREPVNQAGGFDATVRVRAVIKGPPPGPVVLLRDLGDPTDQTCTSPPALARGGRYVLFLNGAGQGANAVWSLVDGQAGVYQLSTRGTVAPPDVAGGKPQVLPIPPAELLRDVGTAASVNAAHVEAIIADAALAETLDQPQVAAAAPTRHFWQTLPLRDTALAVAAAAGVLASLLYLLWRPTELLRGRRP